MPWCAPLIRGKNRDTNEEKQHTRLGKLLAKRGKGEGVLGRGTMRVKSVKAKLLSKHWVGDKGERGVEQNKFWGALGP